ncbi:hypothetical protein Q8G40_30375, partial [Klebsiella pneumoniae]
MTASSFLVNLTLLSVWLKNLTSTRYFDSLREEMDKNWTRYGIERADIHAKNYFSSRISSRNPVAET